jgi:bacillithiol system protein YtxJ
MNFFKNIFGNTETESQTGKIDWCLLNDVAQLNEIIVASKTKPIIIFKHSTRCSISRMVLKQFENEFDLQENVTPYYLDLLNFRDISNGIAIKFNVIHQSPQILLIKDGVCTYSITHENINADSLKEKV